MQHDSSLIFQHFIWKSASPEVVFWGSLYWVCAEQRGPLLPAFSFHSKTSDNRLTSAAASSENHFFLSYVRILRLRGKAIRRRKEEGKKKSQKKRKKRRRGEGHKEGRIGTVECSRFDSKVRKSTRSIFWAKWGWVRCGRFAPQPPQAALEISVAPGQTEPSPDKPSWCPPSCSLQAGRKQAVDQEVNAELSHEHNWGESGLHRTNPCNTENGGEKKWVTGYWATADIDRVPNTSLPNI